MIQIAHRGYSNKCGDNNIPSFLEAIYYGFDMVEMDIQLCKTGEIVVFHDTYLHNKPIQNYTRTELQNEYIVTLDTVFDMVKIDVIKIYLDIKGNENVIHPLIDMLRTRFSSRQLRRIYISSFNCKFVDPLLKSQLPVKIGFSTANLYDKNQLELLCNNVNFVCVDWTALDHDSIEMLHEKGIYVYAYTCTNEYVLNYMKQYKLDGIVTNYLL